MLRIVVTHSSDLCWKKEFYNLLRMFRSDECEIFLPQDDGVKEKITKEMIKNCDFVIAEVSFPSTGQGIELGWADVFSKKIYCFNFARSTPSSALRAVAEEFVPYNGMEDLGKHLSAIIRQM
jgi:hypothetical protein